MDAFAYLAVFVSIILGLGVTKLLSGVADLVRSRARVEIYWPALLWMFTLFVLHVQLWWSLFSLRAVAHWTFVEFALTAMRPAMLFLASAFIVPDFSDDRVVDMREAYFRESRWFFACLIVGLVCSRAAALAIASLNERAPVVAAQFLFLGVAIVGLLSRNNKVHKAISVSAAVLYSLYVGLLFANLA